MKQFIPQVGGHDLRLDDFVVMEQAYSEALIGVVSAFEPSGTCVLSGLVQSGTSTLTFTAGWVAFKGEVFKFDLQTLAFVFGGRLFLKILETVIVPSSPVPYEDTTNKNVHYERVMIIKYFNTSDGDVDGGNGIYFDTISWAGTFQKGFVIEWYPSFAGEENTVFDSTGLGIGRMRGWHVCNGILTPDLRGQFTFMPSVGMFNPAALLPNVVTGVGISTRTGAAARTILTSNLPAAPVTLTMNAHTHTTNAHTHTENPHDHYIKAQSKINRESFKIDEYDPVHRWTYFSPVHSNWSTAWHPDPPGFHSINWAANGAGAYGSCGEPNAGMPMLSWVIDVNTPFEDWTTNWAHAQQPQGFQLNAPGGYGTSGMSGGYPADLGHTWSPGNNTSYPDPASPMTTNGYEKNFGGKIISNTATINPATVTVNSATSTGSGVVNGGGLAFTTVPPGFSMIKILKIF